VFQSRLREPFDGFGPSALSGAKSLPVSGFAIGDDHRESRRLLRAECPAQPGIYGMLDADDQLIYVGKSKSLRHRVTSYFQAAAHGEKAARIIAHSVRIVWEPAPHEFIALVRELELIRRWQPRFNVQGQPGRRKRTFVCLADGDAPYVYLASKPTGRAGSVFGPLPAGARTREAIKRMNLHFKLRDCPDNTAMTFADEPELFVRERQAGCLRYDLGTCLGPCAAGCARTDYSDQVRAARAFLRGTQSRSVDELARDMQTAAAERNFERAALLRDAWDQLQWLHEQLERLKHVRQHYSFVYPLPSYDGGESWCLVDRGHLSGTIPAPRQRRSAERCLARLDELYPVEGGKASLPHEDLELVLLVAGWFRKHPVEFDGTLTPEQARRICRAHLEASPA
jgi:excinuclease ABC subunit C